MGHVVPQDRRGRRHRTPAEGWPPPRGPTLPRSPVRVDDRTEETRGEAHIPAQQPEAGQAPRLPAPDVGSRRAGDHQVAAAQGPQAALCLVPVDLPAATVHVFPSTRNDGRLPVTAPPATGRHTVWRVRRRASFGGFARGRRGRAGPITVSWVPGQPTEPPRVAYAIGKRVGPAVVRNRLRRRLRMIVREVAPTLPPGAYLIGAGPPAALSPYDELRAMVPQAIAISTRPAGRVPERR